MGFKLFIYIYIYIYTLFVFSEKNLLKEKRRKRQQLFQEQKV